MHLTLKFFLLHLQAAGLTQICTNWGCVWLKYRLLKKKDTNVHILYTIPNYKIKIIITELAQFPIPDITCGIKFNEIKYIEGAKNIKLSFQTYFTYFILFLS